MKKLHSVFFAILFFSFFFIQSNAFAQNVQNFRMAETKASINDTDPAKPTLVLDYESDTGCQFVNTSLGTVTVTRFQQGGKEIEPIAVNVALDEGMDEYHKRRTEFMPFDKPVEIPLQVFPNGKDGYALQTVAWSKMTGAYGLMYPFDPNKPYILDITYDDGLGVGSCGLVLTTNAPPFDFKSLLIKIIMVCILTIPLLFILLLWWLTKFLRSRKNKSTVKKKKTLATGMILAVLLPSLLAVPQLAQAEYTIPESSTGAFNDCLAILDAHPDITGDVLDRLDGARIDIFPTHDGSNWATDWPDGSYRIYWDPNSEYNYHSDDGTVIVSTPCDRLFHEMYHIYELMNGSFSRQFCGSSGIEMKEYNAVRAQNRLRERLGLAPRTHYGTERLPDSCDPTPAPESTCSEDESCGETTGEPHLKTFDGRRYDFQAVGEFVLARSSESDFEVQTRQSSVPNARDVSMNTGVAMNVHGDKVELTLFENAFHLLINGKRVPLATTQLPNGGSVTTTDQMYATVTWPDNSRLHVLSNGIALDLLVSPARTHAGKLVGLLGNFNDDSTDDIQLNGGVIEPEFDNLYPKYADSWRITDETSLFTYAPTFRTKSFTDKSFPDRPITPDSLTYHTAAETWCKNSGIINPDILNNCIFDVGLTGRPEFIFSALSLQQAITATKKAVNYGGQTWQAEIKNPGESAEFGFDAIKGEEYFVLISNSTLKYQCGGFGIKDPSGNLRGSGCIVDGSGHINTVPITETGKHTVFLDPAENETGTATVQIIKAQHFESNIQVNGPAVTARMPVPGSHATLSFAGQAGQRVYIELSNATIPDQCGGFLLAGPNQQRLESACLSNHQGTFNENGVLLPEAGTYTIEIDPADENVGNVSVRVRE